MPKTFKLIIFFILQERLTKNVRACNRFGLAKRGAADFSQFFGKQEVCHKELNATIIIREKRAMFFLNFIQ